MNGTIVDTICKPGSDQCCRFLAMDKYGWDCLKFSTLAGALNKRVAGGNMKAKGDNCPGIERGA